MVANIAVFHFSHTCFYRYMLLESSSHLYIAAHTLLLFFFLLSLKNPKAARLAHHWEKIGPL